MLFHRKHLIFCPFLYIFWPARVCWPLHYLRRPFCIFKRCLDSNPESCPVPQPAHVQRFCVNLRWDFRCIGPSSFDCVYIFSQASSQHKYTVTSHLAYDNVYTVLSCPAWLVPSRGLPPMTYPMYSLIRGVTEASRFYLASGHWPPISRHSVLDTHCVRIF
jgi:hypothetical protein